MNLQEIKDQVAKEYISEGDKTGIYINSWGFLMQSEENLLWPEVCKRACLETGRLTLEKAAKKISSHPDGATSKLIKQQHW